MAKSFSAKFNKSGKDLYNIALEAIINIGYNIDSEDNKKLIIFAKTSMSWKTFGQDLEISIKGSNIKLQTRSGQLTDWGEGREISEKLFDEIKKLSKSVKKIKPVKKEKIEQSIQKTKKSTQSKNWWIFGAWISGAVGFVIYLIVILGSGGNGGNNSKNLVSPIGKTNSEVAVCLGFLTEIHRVEKNLRSEQHKFIEMHRPFMSKIETILNKINKEPWRDNQRIENVKNLMSNYSEIEKELYYNLVVGQNMYSKMSSTQRSLTRLTCSIIN